MQNRISQSYELAALRMFDVAEATWDVHDLSDGILKGARAEFPVEPVRTLDALHLSTAMEFYEAFGELTMLSFDERVRVNASALGMALSPMPARIAAQARNWFDWDIRIVDVQLSSCPQRSTSIRFPNVRAN
ncbi:MAG: hypothetical protein H7Z40_16265 [Phycisphaerae bacterium]|nr:hypothetical protein [Gemmatimonadaceae bacterium]